MKMLGSASEIFAMYAIASMLNLFGTCWASGVMFRGRSMQFAPAMQVPIFVMIFLAPVYVPLHLLKGWIHVVASGNPVTYILEACRGLLAGYHQHVELAAISTGALFVVAIVWSLTGLRSATRAG